MFVLRVLLVILSLIIIGCAMLYLSVPIILELAIWLVKLS